MIKNIVFDVGDVLLQYRWRDMLHDYGLDYEEAEYIGDKMFNSPGDLWHEFDLGIMSDEEIKSKYEELYPEDGKIIRWFIEHGEYMHVPRPRVWKRVHELKEAGYKIYLLSNYCKTLFDKHTQYCDFMDDIDGLMVSYMINVCKPDKAIYQALCDKYNLKPEECFFFDDRAENVQGAIDFGMQSKLVESQDGLLEDLKEF